ncbi:MAG: RNase adapter RapZ [Oscillospiraceae bacterium]|jgi:UPF0042 nucleotide-binding protein|nr:RNase adapter RapZ [Oscillospiraceae bacterium]
MEWIILTGMSGAGKTKALNTLEDLGYSCVDNLPPKLLPTLAEIRRGATSPATVVVDARSLDGLYDLWDALDALRNMGVTYKILFLDADNSTLVRRYKETRRSHPMADLSDATIEVAIERERDALRPLFDRADYHINTTGILPYQLKSRLTSLLSRRGAVRTMWIHCMSFGFKHGTPADADLIFDVRCLPNPFYVDTLRNLTGLDEPVERYVLEFDSAKQLLRRLEELLAYWVSLFNEEGRAQLTIAVGCTGGRHRSVVFAKELGDALSALGHSVNISHRDIDRSQ